MLINLTDKRFYIRHKNDAGVVTSVIEPSNRMDLRPDDLVVFENTNLRYVMSNKRYAEAVSLGRKDCLPLGLFIPTTLKPPYNTTPVYTMNFTDGTLTFGEGGLDATVPPSSLTSFNFPLYWTSLMEQAICDKHPAYTMDGSLKLYVLEDEKYSTLDAKYRYDILPVSELMKTKDFNTL